MTNTKRILVAGGSGFLGINLCKDLLAKGHEVICLDNFSSGSRANLQHLFQYQTKHSRLTSSPRSVVGPVNLGNPEEFTVLELAKKVIDLTSSSST